MPHAGAKFLCNFRFWNWLSTSSVNAQFYLKTPFDNSVAADALTFTSASEASELTNMETIPQHSYYRIHNCKIARLLIHTDRVILIPQLYTVDPNCRKKNVKNLYAWHTYVLLVTWKSKQWFLQKCLELRLDDGNLSVRPPLGANSPRPNTINAFRVSLGYKRSWAPFTNVD